MILLEKDVLSFNYTDQLIELGNYSGADLHKLGVKLFPLNRSLTGLDNKKTLEILSKFASINIKSWPSASHFGSWSIPQQWEVDRAYIITPKGKKICDFHTNNLHLSGYSRAFKGKLSLRELKKKLRFDRNNESAIPYNTHYYNFDWSFNISYNEYLNLQPGNYEVVVEVRHFQGEMHYADQLVIGESDDEILISSYICHPSMANNELSGPLVLIGLLDWLNTLKNQHKLKNTYRFVLTPETIGAIAYINTHLQRPNNLKLGMQLSCVGGPDNLSWLETKFKHTELDRLAENLFPNALRHPFSQRGSDERQYSGSYLNLPMISLFRSKYGEYDYYHTSKDDFSFVTSDSLQSSLVDYKRLILSLEFKDLIFKSTDVGEPFLSKFGLYQTNDQYYSVSRLQDIHAYCDGNYRVFDIAQITELDLLNVVDVIIVLERYNLLSVVR